MQFAEIFPDGEIVVSGIRQLSWLHILALVPVADPINTALFWNCVSLNHESYAYAKEIPYGVYVGELARKNFVLFAVL